MTNRATRRALQGTTADHQLRQVLDDLRGVQASLAAVSEAARPVPEADGPVNLLGQRMETVARDLSRLPGEANTRMEQLRAEAFVGVDRSGVATVTLTDACTEARIDVDAASAHGLDPTEVAGRIEEAFGAAARRFREQHQAAQDWINEAVAPMRQLVDTANADLAG